MRSIGKVAFGGFAVLLSVLLLGLSPVYADLVHRYDFATDASDSVGTADGTLVASGTGTATISGGVLSTTSVLGQWSGGAPTNGVGLPASVVSGITGPFTIEAWTNFSFGGGYTTSFSFSDTTTSNYVLATPARGNPPYASTISVIGGGGPAGEQQASGRYFDFNDGIHQMLVTFDGTNLTYYQDTSTDFAGFNTANGLSASINVAGLNLSTLTAIGINGGAPWPDNSPAGSTLDFRIYDSAVNASQVVALFALGADATNTDIATALTTPANLWNVDADGNWNTGSNWYSGSAPGTGEDVTLGDVVTADRTVTLDVSPSVNSLNFQNSGDGDYFIAPDTTETLTLTGDARISAIGRHWLRAEVAGTAGLNATGSGELVLDADNSFTGGVTVSNANLSVVNTDAIPAGNAIVLQNNGDLRFFGELNGFFHDDHGSPGFGTGTISSSVSVASGSILAVWDGADLTLSGAVTANGILSADNATLTLGSASTTTFNLADGGASGSIVGAGTVNLNGTFSLNTASVTDTLAAWSLVNVGTLTETFGGSFSVTGYTESGGIWTSGNYAFNEATGLLSLGDVWGVDADGTYSTASNWNKGAAPAANADVMFSTVISDNRTVTLDNGGASVVVNSLTFDNQLNAGDYFIVPDTTESLTVTSGDVTILAGRHWLRAEVAGTAGLNISGTGELVLDADNSFSGGITIDGTDLSVVHTDAIPAGNDITIQNGSELQFFGPDNGFFVDTNGAAGYGTGTVDGAITLNTGTVLRVTDGAHVTFSGAISGDGHIEVNLNGGGDNGVATFTAANTYTGTIQTWNSGIIALSGAGTLGVEDGTRANGTFLSNQGQLALDDIAVGNEFFYLDASAETNQAKIASSGTSSIAGNIYAGDFGTGVYQISSAAGGTLTLSGILSAVDNATPSQRTYVFSGDGDIHITGRITDQAVTVDGVISNPSTGANINVVKRGAGTLTIEPALDTGGSPDLWRGNTTVEGGTLKLVSTDSANELYSAVTTVRAGATLDVSDFSVYDLQLNAALAGGGTIDVGSGELAIYDDNSITPGDSVGTLHVTGNASLTSDVTGGSLNYELGNTTTVGGTENDLLAVTGTLTTSGSPVMSLNVNFVEGSIAAGGSTYTLATFATSTAPSVSGITAQAVDSDGNALTIRPTLAVSSTTTTIRLGVTGNTQSYNWSGTTNGTWDKGSSGTNNWTSSDSKFYDLDSVTFGSGPANTMVTVAENVAPGSMTVNGGASYQFSGSDINAASVTVTGNATANFSNSVGGAVTVASTGTLASTGTFKNNVMVQSGGRIRIGAAGLASGSPLVDNFNSYDNSTITTVGANAAGDATGGVWDGVFDGTDNARIFDDPAANDGGAGDNMLEVYGANGAWRGAEANLADNFDFDRSIKNGNTSTTVFMQFQAKDPGAGNNMDSVWGLTGADENLNDGSPWNGYAIMGIVGDVGTPNNIHFRIFDGAGGTNSEVTVIGNMALDTWYNAWFVVNEAAETYDLYTSTGTDAGTLVGTYNFGRATGTSGLQKLGFTELVSSGGDTHDSALRIDNIYVASGVDTTNPLVNGSWGGTVFATEKMTVQGDVNLEDGSTVTFDIASSGVNDSLDIAGNLDVADGFILEVLLDGSISASSLSAGNTWDLFDFGTSSGTFDETDFILPGGLGTNLAWDTSNLLVDGTISIMSLGLLGDFNNDGIVDAADYTVWRDHLGEGDETALNGNGDGMNGVDEADYALWKGNFGATLGAGSGAAEPQGVPEPSSIVLFASILGCGAFALRRRS